MATGFRTADKCQGDGCQEATDLNYSVKENQRLCAQCAFKKKASLQSKGETRWLCDKHGKKIKFYCSEHQEGVCSSCAIVSHRQCDISDLKDEKRKKRQALEDLRKRADAKLSDCAKLQADVVQSKDLINVHIESLRRDLKSFINGEIKTENAREQEDASAINKEADEEIRKINHIRFEQLRRRSERAKTKLSCIRRKEADIISCLKEVADKAENKLEDLIQQSEHEQKVILGTLASLEHCIADEMDVLRFDKQGLEDTIDCVRTENESCKHIRETVQGVRFLKRTAPGRPSHCRVSGFRGEWTLDKTIAVHDAVTRPVLVGLIDDNDVVVTDFNSNNTYVTDLSSGISKLAVSGGDSSCIVSCASVDEDTIVCGRAQGKNSLCVCIYNHEWEVVKEVDLRDESHGEDAVAYVDVDPDGLVVAAGLDQCRIHFVHPLEVAVADTIVTQKPLLFRSVLSSGEIVAQHSAPIEGRLVIADRNGSTRDIKHIEQAYDCAVDPLNDDIYVLSCDVECRACTVDHLSGENYGNESRILHFVMASCLEDKNDRLAHVFNSRLLMTPSEKLVVCDGHDILVFKKKFKVEF